MSKYTQVEAEEARGTVDDLRAFFAEYGPVEELDFDEAFLAHLAERATYQKHQVAVTEILDVHRGAPKFFRNSGTGRAPTIMVGITARGRWLCVPIEPTGRPGIWRPVTAFEANAHHREKYQEGGSA